MLFRSAVYSHIIPPEVTEAQLRAATPYTGPLTVAHDLMTITIGDQITVADYLGSAIMSIGELIHCDMSKYPNVQRWIGNVKKQPNYEKINDAAFNGFAASTKGKAWQTV